MIIEIWWWNVGKLVVKAQPALTLKWVSLQALHGSRRNSFDMIDDLSSCEGGLESQASEQPLTTVWQMQTDCSIFELSPSPLFDFFVVRCDWAALLWFLFFWWQWEMEKDERKMQQHSMSCKQCTVSMWWTWINTVCVCTGPYSSVMWIFEFRRSCVGKKENVASQW